jgi:hypothetical protein
MHRAIDYFYKVPRPYVEGYLSLINTERLARNLDSSSPTFQPAAKLCQTAPSSNLGWKHH